MVTPRDLQQKTDPHFASSILHCNGMSSPSMPAITPANQYPLTSSGHACHHTLTEARHLSFSLDLGGLSQVIGIGNMVLGSSG